MQKFRFRLDSVLKLRTMRLNAERDKLGKAVGEVARIERAIETLAEERAAATEFVKQDSATGATELRALSAYLLGYEVRLIQMQQSLEAAQDQLQQQRQKVVAADRDERLLIKLKAKQRAEWQVAADHELEILAQESWNSVHFGKDS
jgi:flagellar export protein FliJ